MATTYVPSIRGYINDVPEIWFKRNSDGKVFHFDEITDASASPNVEFTEVNGGWSLYPVAYLPAASTMEMTFTSAQFSGDLFAMANDTNFETETITVPVTQVLTVDKTAYTAVIDADIPMESIVINGMDQYDADGDNTLDDNEFKVEKSGSKITLTFTSAMAGMDVEVNYEKEETASVIKVDNTTTAVGELILKYPVYATGDETKAAGVKGYYLMDVLKCRVTAMPKRIWAA